MTGTLARWTRAFCHFWWDFLVGDTPEFFVVMLVLVGIAYALRHDRVAAIVLLPLLAIVALLGSAWRGRAKAKKQAPAEPAQEG